MTKIHSKSIYRILALIAYFFVILTSLTIIILSLSKPQYDLPPLQMAISALGFAIIISASYYIWNKFISCKKKICSIAYAILLPLFFLALLLVSFVCRNSLHNQWDYETMWQMAMDITKGNNLYDHNYLNAYSNNFKPMLFLSVIFRLSSALHINDPYYVVVTLSVIIVISTIWAVSFLAAGTEKSFSGKIPVLISFALFLPLWANTQAFYTDTMSFGLILIAFALAKRSLSFSKTAKFSLLVFAGMLSAIGISIKITLLIPAIGFTIAVILSGRTRSLLLPLIIFMLSTVVFSLGIELWACSYNEYVLSKTVSDPIISWIAIGLLGNGSYVENIDLVLHLHSLSSKAEKTAYIKQIIAENKENFFNLTHYIEKIRFIYADGSFGAGVFSHEYHTTPNLLWNAFSTYGKHFWRTYQFCFSYIFGIYIILLVGQIKIFINLLRNKMPSLMILFTDITLLGVFLFMTLWEANNRQLYNQIPIVMLGLILHLKNQSR